MKREILLFIFIGLFLIVPSLKADHTMEIIVKMVGSDSTSNMGTTVAGLGDIDHDGFDDVGVSVYGNKKIFVYYGGNPMDSIPDLVLRGSASIASAGDVNGDGYNDVMTSDLQNVYIFYGGEAGLDTVADITLKGEYPNDYFGRHLMSAKDVNKDNFDDALILAPNYSEEGSHGKLYLYQGGDPMDTIPEWQLAGGSGTAGSGRRPLRTACALDFNADGWIDVVVGREGYYYAGNDSLPGKVDVFFGGPGNFDTIPDLVINPPDTLSYQLKTVFGGYWVSNLGDFNNDGYEDLGILLGFICGHPYVYFGGNPPDTLPSLLLGEGLTTSWNYSCAGDINGDGFVDVVNGNVCWGMDWGAVELYLGGPKFDANKDRWMTADDLPPDFLWYVGKCVASAGDVNGDSTDDIIFGADNFWPTNRGEVFILAGDTSIYVGIEEDESTSSAKPHHFELHQNYPNPFNLVTIIQFTVGSGQSPTHVILKIYNTSGQLVRTLLNEDKKPGTYKVPWNGENNSEKEVASGIYFYQLSAKNFQQTKRMLLIK
jgi:hypothetical protein